MKKLNFSSDYIKKAFAGSLPLEIKFNLLDHDIEEQIFKILSIFLDKFYNPSAINVVFYCTKELISNAEKANIKRLIFQEKELDINNNSDYIQGIKNFIKELKFRKQYISKLRNADKYVQIMFERKGNVLNISVINNSKINSEEVKRINSRVKNAGSINNLVEAYTNFSDNTEGAGLGILTIELAIKKLGLDHSGLSINNFDDLTVARFSVPYKPQSRKDLNIIYNDLINEVNQLPPFPENLIELQRLMLFPSTTCKTVSDYISKDPVLTADLLRTINSPLFMLSTKITSIFSAVNLLGFERLKIMIYSYGTQKRINSRYTFQKDLWDHSHKASFYAKYLGRSLKLSIELLDDIYLTSILHDIGKVVYNAVSPQMTSKIRLICSIKGVTTEVLEEVSAGIHHADLGGRILEKWDFPPHIVSCVKKHHSLKDLNNREELILYPVFMGNYIANIKNLREFSSYLPPQILDHFKIKSHEEFFKIVSDVENAFADSLQ